MNRKLNRNVLARLAVQGRATDKMSAVELDGETGYKALGMTVKDLRKAIREERHRQAVVRSERERGRQLDPERTLHARSEGHYIRLQHQAAQWRQWVRVVPLSEAQRSPYENQVVQIGRQYIRSGYDMSRDNTCYSRSWHRRYGAVEVLSNRRAELVGLTPRGCEAVASFPLDSFRGHWLERANAKLLGNEALNMVRLTDPDRSVRERGILRLAKSR